MAKAAWGWRRWILSGHQDEWIERMQAAGCATWTLTERPDRRRVLLAVYQDSRKPAFALREQFGGIVRPIEQSEWLSQKPVPPTRIGRELEIIHNGGRRGSVRGTGSRSATATLHIPHGLAFGSGEHATTFMFLQALTAPRSWSETNVLDLGTGSGVLALAARLFGAKKIVATDFDSDAVRTAHQNEAINFAKPLIRWQCADVRKLTATSRYELVLANLFSGILCEAAVKIARMVSLGGQLWLSGILHSQRNEVIDAYRAQGLKLAKVNRRGKWIMLQWTAPLRTRPGAK